MVENLLKILKVEKVEEVVKKNLKVEAAAQMVPLLDVSLVQLK